jgi:hypothetical protein
VTATAVRTVGTLCARMSGEFGGATCGDSGPAGNFAALRVTLLD